MISTRLHALLICVVVVVTVITLITGTAVAAASSRAQQKHAVHPSRVHHAARATINLFDVTKYGATGNGVTDDTLAIQAATTALVAAAQPQQENILYLPSGTYLVSLPPSLFNDSLAYFSIPAITNVEWTITGDAESSTTIIWNPNNTIPLFSFTSPSGPDVFALGSKLTFTQLTVTINHGIQFNEENAYVPMFECAGIKEIVISDFTYSGLSPEDQVSVLTIAGSALQDSVSSLSITSSKGMNVSNFLLSDDFTTTSISQLTLESVNYGMVFSTSQANVTETQTITIDQFSITNYYTAIEASGAISRYNPSEIFNVNITNSQFTCGSAYFSPQSNAVLCQMGLDLNTPGTISITDSTFEDEFQHNVKHIASAQGIVIVSGNTFRSGQQAFYVDLQLTSLILSNNIFQGNFTGTALIEMDYPTLSSQTIMNNQCQGPDTQFIFNATGCTSTPSSYCQVNNNQGCTVVPPPQ